MLAVGLWAWAEKDTLANFSKLTNIALDPALVFIVIGLTMFIIGFAGCVGSLRENTCLLLFVSHVYCSISHALLVRCRCLCCLFVDGWMG